MKRTVRLLLIILSAGHLVYGQSKSIDSIEHTTNQNHNLKGTWIIEEIHYIYSDTTYEVPMNYKGRLMINSDSYSIMYNPYGSTRESPKSLSDMTDEEKLYSFKTIVFNSGVYKLTSTDFITTSEAAKVAGFEGGIQYYQIGKEGNRMTLTMYDETYPDGGKPEWYGKLKVRFILSKHR
ncbi:hypothetical protein [Reichenbachiella sp.]|uniref:hypothetical protein n=1 Tax=Reichenbachiella sp. TaxID=2184521 RepID=UPI003B5B7612